MLPSRECGHCYTEPPPKLTSLVTPHRSTTGIVNLYDSATALPESGAERKAIKAIGNLTTSVTSMRFNHDSQILALASRTNKDQMKLVSAVARSCAVVGRPRACVHSIQA